MMIKGLTFVPMPQPDNVLLLKEVVVQQDGQSDNDFDEDNSTIKSGRYSMDSLGRVWKLDDEMSNLFNAFDHQDPQIAAERRVRRAKEDEKKKKPRRRKQTG